MDDRVPFTRKHLPESELGSDHLDALEILENFSASSSKETFLAYLDSLDLQLHGCVLVNDNHGVGVHLKAGQCAHVVHTSFNTSLKSQGFVGTGDYDDDLMRLYNVRCCQGRSGHPTYIQHCLNSNSQCHPGYLIQIIVKES